MARTARRSKPSYSWRELPWWIQTSTVIGILATAGVIAALFFTFGNGPARITLTSTPPVDSQEFVAAVAGAAGTPLRQGGTARLLNNGVEFFPALNVAIRAARRSVNVSCYIWRKGRVNDEVVAALLDRARAGVPVRILLDGFGGARAPRDSIDALRAAGAKVDFFRAPRLGKLTRFHKRNHRRAIVIDGSVGFTGGMAVADQWLGNADSEDHWRDSMVEVTGPLAATLQSSFVDLWAGTTGEVLVGPEYFPPAATSPGAGDHVTLHTGLGSSPSYENRPLRLFFMQSFLAARRRLWISTPYFVPDQATREAVASRARAGVDVRILMPDAHTDALLIRLASHAYYEELLKAGVRVYEYKATMMHLKHVVVDGQWSVVGSANMDIRGNEVNEENVIGILDAEFGRTLEQTFLKDLEKSEEIRLDAWRKRDWERPLQRVAMLFAQQY
jgi:cardiolipin synthase A/B